MYLLAPARFRLRICGRLSVRAKARSCTARHRRNLGDSAGVAFNPAPRGKPELRFRVTRPDIVNVIIDRTFVDADGTRWVVDFKTSPHEGGDRDAFLEEEVKRYRGQLQRYAHFARGLGPQPVRAGLYYPLLGEWREVPIRLE